MTDFGLIGVGFMGSIFVDELTDEGYSLTVYDVDPDRTAVAAEQGATVADSPAAVAAAADVLVLAVPGAPEVEAILTGDDGVLPEIEAGDLVIDTTTTGPEQAERSEALVRERGADFVTAPLTRAAPNRDGVHFFVGGAEDAADRAGEYLDVMGRAHTRIGTVRESQTFKLMLQLRYALRDAVDAEIVSYGQDNGVDPRVLNEFLGMEVDERYFEKDYSPGISGMGGLRIWNKDIGYAMEVARENGTAAPLASELHEIYKATVRIADEDERNSSTLKKYYNRLHGRE